MLANKLVLITGAANGIGLETAKIFVRESATVIGVDVNENIGDIMSSLGPHTGYVCDVANYVQVKNLFQRIKNDFNGATPTVIVNSSGLFPDKTNLDYINSKNLKATCFLSQIACKEMSAQQKTIRTGTTTHNESYGSIINISNKPPKSYTETISRYFSSIESLTQLMAKDLCEHKIRFNTLVPCYTSTPGVLVPNEASSSVRINKTIFKKIDKPNESTELCLFFASDESKHITGSFIKYDDDFEYSNCNF